MSRRPLQSFFSIAFPILLGWFVLQLFPLYSLIFGPEDYSWTSVCNIAFPHALSSLLFFVIFGVLTLGPPYLLLPRSAPFWNPLILSFYCGVWAALISMAALFGLILSWNMATGRALVPSPSYFFPFVSQAFFAGIVTGFSASILIRKKDQNPTRPSSAAFNRI